MPNRYRSQRRKPRKLSIVEFYCSLIWLAQAGGSLAFRRENPRTFADLSYVWSTVGLIVMVCYNIEHVSRIFSARRNQNNQLYVFAAMVLLFIAALALTAFGMYFCGEMPKRNVNVSSVGLLFIWILMQVLVIYGPGLEAFKQSLLFSGWFLIGYLATALPSFRLMVPAGLYALVDILWTFNYLLKFDLI